MTGINHTAKIARAVEALDRLRSQRKAYFEQNGVGYIPFTTRNGKNHVVKASVFDGWIRKAEVDVGLAQGRMMEDRL